MTWFLLGLGIGTAWLATSVIVAAAYHLWHRRHTRRSSNPAPGAESSRDRGPGTFAAVAKLQNLADVLDEDQQGLRRVLLKIARELEGKQS